MMTLIYKNNSNGDDDGDDDDMVKIIMKYRENSNLRYTVMYINKSQLSCLVFVALLLPSVLRYLEQI